METSPFFKYTAQEIGSGTNSMRRNRKV